MMRKISAKLDIRKIQYMNLFERTIGIKAKHCFIYDTAIIFIVPRKVVNKAIGKNAGNINKLTLRLNKKIKIIANPKSSYDLESFINAVIYPNKFRKLFLTDNVLTIFSIPRTKAALIGRGKMRLHSLASIIEKFFGIKKIIIK